MQKYATLKIESKIYAKLRGLRGERNAKVQTDPYRIICLHLVFNLYCTCPFPATSGPSLTFMRCSLIHFSLSATHFKVGCRQSKVNRLFNLFWPCLYTLSCEIAEQQPRQYRDFENIQRAHLPAELTSTTLATFIYVCCCARVHLGFVCGFWERAPPCTHTHTCTDISQSSLTLWKNALQIRERGFEGMTYHLTLYYIRLQSHMAS